MIVKNMMFVLAGAVSLAGVGCSRPCASTLALARNGATPYVLVTPETLQKGV